jgi:hypothetical protein
MHSDILGMSDELSLAVDRPRGFADGLGITGEVYVELRGPDGEIKETRRVSNLVVDDGEEHIADQLSSTPGQAAMSHMAIGTGSTAAAFGDATLGAETDRNALTSRTDSANVVTYVGTWAPGDGTNSALREAGIFNAASNGVMLARAVYSNIDKQAADSLTITWTVTIGTAGA